MNTKNIVIGGLAVLLVVFAILFFKGDANAPVSNTPDGEEVGGNVEFSKKSFTQGFFAGDGREFEVTNQGILVQGNVSGLPVQASIISTTTILAKIQNPFAATSTFSNTACNITTSTSTQTVIAGFIAESLADTFGTSSNGTAFASKTIAASVLGTLSNAVVDNENIIGPSKWLVFGYDSGTVNTTELGVTLGALGQAGNCSSSFQEI